MRSLLVGLGLIGLVAVVLGPGQEAVTYGYWWLTNAAPPEISLSAPSNTLRGPARFAVHLRPDGRASVSAAWVDTTYLEPGELLIVDTARLADGPHRLVVQAEDSSFRRNSIQRAFAFVSDNTPPALEVQLTPPAPVEGHTLVVRARLAEAALVSGALGGRELHFYGSEQERWAVIGFPPEPSYRQLELRLEALDEAGNRREFERRYPLMQTRYPLEELEVSPELERLLVSEVRAVEQARLYAVYARYSGPPRWNGRFLLPVEGPVTTEFGSRRSYNGRFPSDNHAGTDYAAATGTPVRAPADGQVALTGRLEVRGNTLVLDHGAGVFTTYAHLQEILVREGAQVRKGEPVARVGSTGLSTGPHLHWEMWVASANVDPEEWTERGIP